MTCWEWFQTGRPLLLRPGALVFRAEVLVPGLPQAVQGRRMPIPLGHLTVTTGLKALERFESLADKAWFTRKLSVLSPAPLARLPLQLQRHAYLLQDVPLEALGSTRFVADMEDFGLAALSRGALDADAVLCVVPCRLVASLPPSAFRRLGLEEPAPGHRVATYLPPSLGAQQLEKKHLPQRHVCVDLRISKTRAQRAAKAGEIAKSRWQALVEPLNETISLLDAWRLESSSVSEAYCDREPSRPILEPLSGSIQVLEACERDVVLENGQAMPSQFLEYGIVWMINVDQFHVRLRDWNSAVRPMRLRSRCKRAS